MSWHRPGHRGIRVSTLVVIAVFGGDPIETRGAQPVAHHDEAFFYDATGPRSVRIATDAFLVQPQPSSARDASGKPAFFAELSPRLAAPHPAASTLERRLAQRDLHVVRTDDGPTLRAHPDCTYALPLLYRTGSSVPMYLQPQVVLRVRDGVTPAQVANLANGVGADAEALARGRNRYLLTVRTATAANILTAANRLHEQRDRVDYAHPNFFLPKVAYAPPVINDPYYLSLQWHLDGDVRKGADPNSDLDVETAWDDANGPNAQGSPTVHVAIIDECVERLHPDTWPNWRTGLDVDQLPYDDDPSPDFGQRHGTACAGLAVAAGNDIGVRGVAPNCGLIGLKIFGGDLVDTANAFYFCIDPNDDGDPSDGADILSNSWGYADGTLLPPDVVAAINANATQGRNGLGALVLFAAANNDHTINGVSALAQLPTTMAIGGTNSHARHTEFSDVGPEVAITTPTNDRGDDGVRESWLDITTIDNTGDSGYNGLPDLDYTNRFGGTSAATPIAAGVLALILSQDESMTADQARSILQHTAVRLDEPYGRFDPITGHSHRFGFGRADAGAAVIAARAGVRWPDRIRSLAATSAGADVVLAWDRPLLDYAGSLLVRGRRPFGWMPVDGTAYAVGEEVAPGVDVIHAGPADAFIDPAVGDGGVFYAVYAVSADQRYGFGAKTHLVRNGTVAFTDSSEGFDPGWTHGGAGDEWQRGEPTSGLSLFGQSVFGSGPLAGLNGTRAINGNLCWGTDLGGTYAANGDAHLTTPLINLAGVTEPVFLEYHDWCMLDTGFDRCSVEVVDAQGEFLGYVDPDTGGDYDWTPRVYDLSAFAGQACRIRFRIQSDNLFERDGWFIDEVRVTVGAEVPLPPTAGDVYTETTTDTPVDVLLRGADPQPATQLAYLIVALPQHGQLVDPGGGVISTVPHLLAASGSIVQFVPNDGYQGPDTFGYRSFDGQLESNDAVATLSIGTPQVAYDYPLDVDPGWLADGDWAFGVPQGNDGDPLQGATGTNVYGYNLNGVYDDGMSPMRLTTLPINCTGLSRVTLNFQRWLGVEAGSEDNASIEVSRNGNDWVTVWRYTGPDLEEDSWNLQSQNVAAVADDQPFVQFRWVMGPTDNGAAFAGWNLDDIQVTAIGAVPGNQPPLARDQQFAMPMNNRLPVLLDARDPDGDVIKAVINGLPAHGRLRDPAGRPITSTPFSVSNVTQNLVYVPDPGFLGEDTFTYYATDGAIVSNTATVTVKVLQPAPFPVIEDFESGEPLAGFWSTESTNVGRIRVSSEGEPDGAYHLLMDAGTENARSGNAATLVVNLQHASNVLLRYAWKVFDEEADPLPDAWTGSEFGDGVAISADGIHWFKVRDLISTDETPGYVNEVIALDPLVAALGLTYTTTFRIRFSQEDTHPFDTDGIAIDNISVEPATPDPLIETVALPPGLVQEAYGPEPIETSGGDLPLTWSQPIEFFATNLGPRPFAAVGTAQEFNQPSANDGTFTYELPFAFPFFGETYTSVTIATDGWINLGPVFGSTYNNSLVALQYNRRIAPLWDDQRTHHAGTAVGDIYVHSTSSNKVTIRWATISGTAPFGPCNYSATLFADGKIRFDYGDGNAPLTPTVGVSDGGGETATVLLAVHDGVTDLDQADTLLLDSTMLPPGLALGSNGVVDGLPTLAGRYRPRFKIIDQLGRTDERIVQITIAPVPFGDFDFDGDTDGEDHASFVDCVAAEVYPAACLGAFDVDGNGTIDLYDFAAFQQSITW